MTEQLATQPGPTYAQRRIGVLLVPLMLVLFISNLDQTTTPGFWLVIPLVLAGAGIGFFVQVALLAGQNAVEHRDLGVATDALNFFKNVGGGFGAAVFGAILTAAGLATAPAHAFSVVFAATVPIAAVSLILALIMREKPLSEEMIEIADGRVEAPEY
jgi:predicted MFS family arabinose efflux permease